MAISEMQGWMMGAFGSMVGGVVVAWYFGDKKIRDKITFITPFLAIGVLGVFKVFGEEN